MALFGFCCRVELIFGPGALARLGEAARTLGMTRVLLVSDPGMVAAGHYQRGADILERAGVTVLPFHDFGCNPDTEMVERGAAFAAGLNIDGIIGLGGGSSLDCAKGINFVLTNGAPMRQFHGWGKATRPMLPMIAAPTTAGTGSEAQSYALISDAETHVKMACGDPKAAFRMAILDPELLVSQPDGVRAAAGYDAVSHAIETWVTTKRSPLSSALSREAWRLLDGSFERVFARPDDVEACGNLQLGAFLAGLAIENSMLGAAHACANPLTATYGTTHGVAIAALLPHVVRWNEPVVGGAYRELSPDLPARLETLAAAAGLPVRLAPLAVPREDFPSLAEAAASQWTGRFNPRPFDAAGALEVYECAY
ncbi:MAG: iron-containing alcohol dehydrogenase [Bryobacterales bacterium]|nr:iron-containing alcohol dehydrogenase [Bryobacterales bacterium]